jgi:hypothetical protein
VVFLRNSGRDLSRRGKVKVLTTTFLTNSLVVFWHFAYGKFLAARDAMESEDVD